MKNTLIVNLFGGAGIGKSTLMARIFSELKVQGYDCEMVTEDLLESNEINYYTVNNNDLADIIKVIKSHIR